MINSGAIGMPLHYGKLPKWLSERMGNMGITIIESVVQNYGKSEVLTRMSDPNWFQALGAVMGMQWNSSGVTATVLGSLRRKVNPRANDLGLFICGGKGRYSYYAPNQIMKISDVHGLEGDSLVKSCKLTRKIDNNAIIDGYNLYQQYFILSNEGEWTSISQGMKTSSRRARRYHWHSPSVKSFISNPHTGIVGEKEKPLINLVDEKADKTRDNMLDIINENPESMINEIRKINLPDHHDVKESDVDMRKLGAVLNIAYNKEINNFEDLIMLHGMGPKTLKSLALVSEVIHGDSTRFEDPSRFSFAVGGKDGLPHPIDTKAYDETIDVLQDSVEKSKLGYKDKSVALRRLHRAVKNVESRYTPSNFLNDLLDMEWKDSEKNGGMTIMGKTVKGLTRGITQLINPVLYGDKN